MNLSAANPRHAAAILGAFALFLGLSPAFARPLPVTGEVFADSTAQPPAPAPDSGATPAGDVSPAPSTPVPVPAPVPMADSKKNVKKAKVSKPPKAEKAPKVAKAPKPPKAEKAPKVAKAPKPPKAEKAPKVAKAKTPAKPYAERRQEDGLYAAGANWLSFRFGYAKRAEDFSGQGLVGYGVGYQRMLTKRFAFALGAGHDVVGHYGSQLDVAVPFTGEFQRHFAWKSAVRPYIGLGGGYYLRKFYRTGPEYATTTTGGGHVSVGFISAVTDRHAIGLETRMAFLKGRPDIIDPTFGPGVGTETLWSAKVSWALIY